MLAPLREMQDALIAKVRVEFLPAITANPKFIGGNTLAQRFLTQVGHWKGDGEGFRQILETINEIATARIIVTETEVSLLEYEPRLRNTKKSFDFRITLRSDDKEWVDVKSINPNMNDDEPGWERYKAIAAKFPSNAKLIVNQELLGAGLAGQEFKCRWSLANYAQEIDEKVALLTQGEKAPVRVIFCTNGPLRYDAVQDFAHFYRTGVFRDNDWSCNDLIRHINEKCFVYNRTIDGFGYHYFRWETGETDRWHCEL